MAQPLCSFSLASSPASRLSFSPLLLSVRASCLPLAAFTISLYHRLSLLLLRFGFIGEAFFLCSVPMRTCCCCSGSFCFFYLFSVSFQMVFLTTSSSSLIFSFVMSVLRPIWCSLFQKFGLGIFKHLPCAYLTCSVVALPSGTYRIRPSLFTSSVIVTFLLTSSFSVLEPCFPAPWLASLVFDAT